MSGARRCRVRSNAGGALSVDSFWVFVRFAGARVGDAEAAIAARDDLEVRPVATAFEVGDERRGAIVRGVGIFGRVQHVQILQAGALVHGLPRLGTACLVRAVVHDGDTGMNRIDKGLRVRKVESVMIHQIKVNVSDQIVGADEGDLLCLGEIAEIEKIELAEAHQDTC
jgi:hypothetical protein